MTYFLNVNGQVHAIDVDGDTPLLWVLRDSLKMTGTKFGCGAAMCGACTVHVDGQAMRSCVLPIEAVGSKPVRTIEGLADMTERVLQQAWISFQVPQCGYCQSGALMAAAALMAHTPQPTDADIDTAMTNICRCGTYPRMRAAIHSASKQLAQEKIRK